MSLVSALLPVQSLVLLGTVQDCLTPHAPELPGLVAADVGAYRPSRRLELVPLPAPLPLPFATGRHDDAVGVIWCVCARALHVL